MGASLKITQNNIAAKLEDMARNSKDSSGFLNRVIYRMYQNAQIERWMTENSSQGGKWKPLNPRYAAYKKRAYGGGTKFRYYPSLGLSRPIGVFPTYPGKGTKMMIATGRLAGSVIGPNPEYKEGVGEHRKYVTENTLTIETVVPYGKDAAEQRPFMQFSDRTLEAMRAAYKQWVLYRRTF